MDWSFWALIAFGKALENEPDSRSGLDSSVLVASVWISIAGEKLYRKMVEEDGDDVPSGGLWEPPLKGFTVESWEFWKGAFGEVSRCDEASEETRKIARGRGR